MPQDLKVMLEEINRAIESGEFHPSQWEEGFLETVTELINFELALSEKQDEHFEKIWSKATRGHSVADDPDEDDFV